VLASQKVDEEGELTANGDQTARYVRTLDRERIPGVEKKEDSLWSHTDRVALVAHDFYVFYKVTIDLFDCRDN
jgi:hypothetical protein